MSTAREGKKDDNIIDDEDDDGNGDSGNGNDNDDGGGRSSNGSQRVMAAADSTVWGRRQVARGSGNGKKAIFYVSLFLHVSTLQCFSVTSLTDISPECRACRI